ncbi:ThuA domain-containing protein [Alteromonas aestuariivivens]|uniref:ThuA domain-containing protein n=1 Tax=Alteromonas aestuariivivens TaxID=1938339 RepID=UPI0015F28087|nr:ThuA domain-containing protein [Alteromonas aestuariivivens]
MFTKTEGFRHKAIEPAVAALTQSTPRYGYQLVVTENASDFNPQNLSRYATVMFLLTTGDVLDEQQQHAFENYISNGGSFVGVHSATDTEKRWPWYGQLVGARFIGHPNHPNVREGLVHPDGHPHPSIEFLPDPWLKEDEWYELEYLNPAIQALLWVDETSYKRSDENAKQSLRPLAWELSIGKGRVFYTALGHTAESYQDPLFLQHLWGGIIAVNQPPVPQ